MPTELEGYEPTRVRRHRRHSYTILVILAATMVLGAGMFTVAFAVWGKPGATPIIAVDNAAPEQDAGESPQPADQDAAPSPDDQLTDDRHLDLSDLNLK